MLESDSSTSKTLASAITAGSTPEKGDSKNNALPLIYYQQLLRVFPDFNQGVSKRRRLLDKPLIP
jgi:hypothetical protein